MAVFWGSREFLWVINPAMLIQKKKNREKESENSNKMVAFTFSSKTHLTP